MRLTCKGQTSTKHVKKLIYQTRDYIADAFERDSTGEFFMYFLSIFYRFFYCSEQAQDEFSIQHR